MTTEIIINNNTLGNLNPGECFIFEDSIYMRTVQEGQQGSDDASFVTVICLNNGQMQDLEYDLHVSLSSIKIQVTK